MKYDEYGLPVLGAVEGMTYPTGEPYVSHFSKLIAENVHLSAVNLRLSAENERLRARIAELEQEYWDLFRDSGWR